MRDRLLGAASSLPKSSQNCPHQLRWPPRTPSCPAAPKNSTTNRSATHAPLRSALIADACPCCPSGGRLQRAARAAARPVRCSDGERQGPDQRPAQRHGWRVDRDQRQDLGPVRPRGERRPGEPQPAARRRAQALARRDARVRRLGVDLDGHPLRGHALPVGRRLLRRRDRCGRARRRRQGAGGGLAADARRDRLPGGARAPPARRCGCSPPPPPRPPPLLPPPPPPPPRSPPPHSRLTPLPLPSAHSCTGRRSSPRTSAPATTASPK